MMMFLNLKNANLYGEDGALGKEYINHCGKADGHCTPETVNADKEDQSNTWWKRRGKARGL